MFSHRKKILFFFILFTLLIACAPIPANQAAATPSPAPTVDTCLLNELIAFNSNRDGHTEVYTMGADGSNQTRLTVFKQAENLVAAWSPDGTRIAFTSKQDEEAQVYIVTADGSHQINLTNAYLTGNFEALNPAALAPVVQKGDFAPSETAESIRTTLFHVQSIISDDPKLASQERKQMEAAYSGRFADGIKTAAPEADARIREGFASAAAALAQSDVPAFAAARSQIWTSILAGSYAAVENALKRGDGPGAQTWLSVREFRTLTTRFSRSNVDATVAINSFSNGEIGLDDALLALRADLLDTYQARLNQSLTDLAKADASGFAARRAELAALAEGYFLILAPDYAGQRDAEAAARANAAFAELRANAVTGKDIAAAMQKANESLRNFRAVSLSAAEQSRRSGQLMRYLSLVPVEYKRGVSDGQVIRDFEIQEAIAFHTGAYAAFSDLEYLLDARNPAKTLEAGALFDAIDKDLADAGKQTTVALPDKIQSQVDALIKLLTELMPAEWATDTSPADIYEVYDADPAWSPDGRKIALVSNDGVDLEAGGDLNIYVMNVNGAHALEITKNHPKYNGNPAWSPDARKIAFVSDRDGNLDIYLMNADGSQQTNLTHSPGADQSIAWSPEGRKILFVSERDGNSEIYSMNADGSGVKNLTNRPSASDESPAWSPDGSKIVFASSENGQSDIFVMNADGSGQVNLTHTPSYEITPRWSPDGLKIAFVTNRDGNLEIYVMDRDGSAQTNLTHNPAEDTEPIWSLKR